MEGWFCSDCKSLNGQRVSRCYSCNTPRKFAEAGILRRNGDIETHTPASAAAPAPDGSAQLAGAPGQRAARQAPPDLSRYLPSGSLALPLMAMLAVCVGHAALTMMLVTTKGGVFGLAVALVGGSDYSLSWFLPLVASRFGLLAITAALWFVWFDRVLQNVPILTGGWPENSRSGAIGWWLFPGANLVRGPRVVGDVFSRLSIPGGPGMWLLALWAGSFIGAFVVPALANRVLAWAPFALPEEWYQQATDVVSMVGQVLEVAAGLLAIGMVVTLEHAQQVRYRQALAERDATAPGGSGVPSPKPAPMTPTDHGLGWATGLRGGLPDQPEGPEPTPVPLRKLVPLTGALVLTVAMSMAGIALGRVLHQAPNDSVTTNRPLPLRPVPSPLTVTPAGSGSLPVPRGNPRVD
jgi:hypothetical protein